MSIFASWSKGGAAGGQSAGGKFDAKAASVFAPAGGSSTGGKEESAFGRGGGGGGRGGGIFGATEKSSGGNTASPAPTGAPPKPNPDEARKAAMDNAMREAPKPDMKSLAPKATGDVKDIKALLQTLQEATTVEAVNIDEFQSELDHNVPTHAVDDLKEMTGMLLKLDEKSAEQGQTQQIMPTAGKSFNKRMSAMSPSEMADAVPDLDTDQNREHALRDTMNMIVKTSKRESDHSATS